MYALARRITDAPAFDSLVAILIVATAITIGVEAVEPLARRFDGFLVAFFWGSQAFFVVEIALRVAAYGPDLRAFFRDPWNRFDFAVVAASCLPLVGSFALVGRLLRILRVVRVISAFDATRALGAEAGVTGGIVAPLAVLLGVLGYTSAVAGHALFHEVDPARWGGLGEALRSVFFLAVVTDVDGIMAAALEASPASLAFFALFYLLLLSVALHAIGVVVARHGKAE